MRALRDIKGWRMGCCLALCLAAAGCDDDDDNGGTGGTAGAGGTGGVIADTGTGGVIPDSGPMDQGVVCVRDNECEASSTYCAIPEGRLEGSCMPGCQMENPICDEGFICVDNACAVDPTCFSDATCAPNEYCLDGDCTEGCRVDPDLCPDHEDGRYQGCDAETRLCTPLVACCTAGELCDLTLPDACDDAPGGSTCFNPNPCTDRCPNGDDDCTDGFYCDDTSHCVQGCRPDHEEDCGEGETCDPERRRCAPDICERDASCPDAFFCDAIDGECVVGCRVDPDNCPVDTFCGVNRQCGAGCDNDTRCEERNSAGWYCVDNACLPPCAQHDDCAAEEICDDARCVIGCRDDGFEPNDGENAATPLDFGGGFSYDSGSGTLMACGGDIDWYRFTVPQAGWNITVNLGFENADGDLDARLHGPDGVVVNAQSGDDDELIEVIGATAGEWRLEVFARGIAENSYRLQVGIAPDGACQPDPGEAGEGDNIAANATLVSPAELQDELTLSDRTLCMGEVDWYAIPMGTGDGVSIQLIMRGNADGFDEELDFTIFGPGLPDDGAMPTFLPNSLGGGGDSPPFIEFVAPRANVQIETGVYYVRVAGFDAQQSATYNLRVAVDRVRAVCLPDSSEPNDALGLAENLMVPAFTRPAINGGIELRPGINLDLEAQSLCGGEEDWYLVNMAPQDGLTASIVRNEPVIEGDTIIEILDEFGAIIGVTGRNAAEVNTARAPALAGGPTYIRVRGVIANTQSEYTLRLERTPGPDVCPADRFDDGAAANNSRETATPIDDGEANLTLCGADDDVDYFTFDTQGLGDIRVSIQFVHAQADLDLDIFRGDALIAENANDLAGHSVSDNEVVELNGRPADRYTVRVSGARNATYALQVEIDARIFLCLDDPDESNDAFADATTLGNALFSRDTQWICDRAPAESDWFQLDIPANTTRTVGATFLFGDDGDLVLEVYDSEQFMLASTAIIPRGNGKQCVIFEPFLGDRSVWVRVVPLSINRIIEHDERLDYSFELVDGDNCDAIGPAAPGVEWPHAAAPN